MSYVVLARKYRPQSFEDLAGQSHVARTLANAIAQNRVAHAFLFTGVRGVGKTTSARLLAKCLNCLGKDGKAEGPTATPCQVCAACTEITNGSDIDVQEIDGASYNGVDEVRRLQEGINFRPARDRFKIYIVDEVHMLSSAAWNAFLKTLEEPPPHVKFIFATTEVHKVPVTILSRCQRYDFKLISASTIGARLREVLGKEEIQADEGAIAILSREAGGSMRDAMSLLDQVIAFSGKTLSTEDVTRVLGVADRKILHDLARAVIVGEAAKALGIVADVSEQGFDIAHLTRDFLGHLRNLVVAKTDTSPDVSRILDLPDTEIADLREAAGLTHLDDFVRLFQGFSAAYDAIVKSVSPRATLEMTLVRLARRPPLLPLDELLSRVGDLERRLEGAPPKGRPPQAGSGSGGGAGGGGGTSRDASSGGQAPRAREGSRSSSFRDSRDGRVSAEELGLMAEPATMVQDRTVGALALAPQQAQQPALRPREVRAPIDLSAIPASHEDYRAIVERVREERPDLASVFSHGAPMEVTRERLIIGYEADSFLGMQASEAEANEILTRVARTYFDAQTKILVDVSAKMKDAPPTLAAVDEARHKERLRQARLRVEQHPTVLAVKRLFGVEIASVKVPEDER